MALEAQAIGQDTENARAWRLYQLLVTKFGVDGQVLPQAFARITRRMDDAEFFDCYQRCSILYAEFHPDPEPETGT